MSCRFCFALTGEAHDLDCPARVASEGDVRALLRDLVNEVNAANAGDMLEGYLDYLADEFNAGLQRAGLPTLEVHGRGA